MRTGVRFSICCTAQVLLYAETFHEFPLNRHGSRWESMRLRPAQEWVTMLRATAHKHRSMRPTSPNPQQWPDRVPTPFVEDTEALHLKSIVTASPLELVLAIPAGAVTALGGIGLVRLLRAVERTWQMPKRIRVEGAELDRQYWEARLEADKVPRAVLPLLPRGIRLGGLARETSRRSGTNC